MRLLCSSVSLLSVCCSSDCSSSALPRSLSSACRLRASTRSNGREKLARPRMADQGAAAAQIVENVGDQVAVAGKRLRDALTQQFAGLHPHIVPSANRCRAMTTMLAGAVDLPTWAMGGPRRRLLIRRRPLRECRFDRARDPRRERIANARGLESVAQRGGVGERVEPQRRHRRRARRTQHSRGSKRVAAPGRALRDPAVARLIFSREEVTTSFLSMSSRASPSMPMWRMGGDCRDVRTSSPRSPGRR